MQRRTDARSLDYPRTKAEDSLEKAKQLVGLKGYVTNIPVSTMAAPEVLSSHHDLWHVEQSFRTSKTDLQARLKFHHQRDAIEARLATVLTALAIARYLQVSIRSSGGH